MYDQSYFTGSSFILTGDDSDFRNHGFDDKLNSLEVKGVFILLLKLAVKL